MTFICLYFPGGVEEGESAFYLLTITFIFSTGFQVSAPLMNDRIWPNDRWAPCYDNSVDNRRQSPDNTVTQGRQFKMWWVFLWEFCFIVYTQTFCVFSFTPAQLNNQSRTLRSLLASYTVISKMITIRKRRIKNPDYAVPQIKTRIYKQAWMINLDSPVEVASDMLFSPFFLFQWLNEWMNEMAQADPRPDGVPVMEQNVEGAVLRLWSCAEFELHVSGTLFNLPLSQMSGYCCCCCWNQRDFPWMNIL